MFAAVEVDEGKMPVEEEVEDGEMQTGGRQLPIANCLSPFSISVIRLPAFYPYILLHNQDCLQPALFFPFFVIFIFSTRKGKW